MGMAVNQQQVQKGKTSLRLLLIVLAVVLFVLPVAAVAKLVLATDDELDDVVAQSLLEFTTVRRTTSGTGGPFIHDVAILKANVEIRIEDMRVNRVLLGYYPARYYYNRSYRTAGNGWDIQIGDANTGIIWGAADKGGTMQPAIFKGLRLEVAYTLDNHFSFLRIGTDDFSGVLDVKHASSDTAGAIKQVSMDGLINARVDALGWRWIQMDVNRRRKQTRGYQVVFWTNVPMTNVWKLYYNTALDGRAAVPTDFYISFSDYIYNTGGGIANEVAINPRQAVHVAGSGAQPHHLPGYGWWMHFNTIHAEAYPW